jgi:hypothetical protein
MRAIKGNPVLVFITLIVLGELWHPVAAWAKNYALLIGIGEYQHPTLVPSLEGPEYDVKGMQQVLKQQGFDHIIALLNAQATKENILNAFRRIQKISRPGDKIVIYFSGHGTSRHNPDADLPLPHHSGALVPYEFSYSENDSAKAVMDRLIVGKTDLKPILKDLDNKGASVLALFDACYSGETIRAVRYLGVGSNRHVQINFRSFKGDSLLDDEDIGEFKGSTNDYPYNNIFYISASSDFEMARDIGSIDIKANKIPTFNMEPHGVLTDAVLKAISGQERADLNNDRSITLEELYQSVTRTVKDKLKFMQTPQSLPIAGPQAGRLRRLAFFNAGHQQTQIYQTFHDIKVQVDDRLNKIKAQMRNVKGLILSNDNPGLRIIPDQGKIILTLADYRRVCLFENQTPEQITQRTLQYAKVLPLVDLTYLSQRHNVVLRLENRLARTIFTPGEEIGFSIESEKKTYILLIDINPKGEINVLYPFTPEELAARPAGRPLNLSKLFEIVPPYGTDTVKAFAFTQKPDGFDAIMGREAIVPGSRDYSNLSKMVFHNASMRTDVAQDTLTVTSYAGDEF